MSLPSNASFQGLPEISQNTEIVIPRKENEQNKTTSAETKSVTTLIPSNQSISNKSMEQSVLSFEKSAGDKCSEIDKKRITTDKSSNINISSGSGIDRKSTKDTTDINILPKLNFSQYHIAISNSDTTISVPKRKSNSPIDDIHINIKKHDRTTDQNNVNESNFIVTSKSSFSHLSTNPNSSTEEIMEKSEPNTQTLTKNTGDRTCERKITPCRQALRHAVHNLYRVDDFHMEKIGAGFFSEVFKVTHKINRKEMVLKLNKHRSNRTNMLKEIQLMKSFDFPNILRLEAACVHEGQLHALTEYASGGNLEQVIEKKNQELPWSLRMSLALDVAKGLTYLHAKGWFHRDLTSKNILIRINDLESYEGNRPQVGRSAVIGDFGLATKIPTRSIGKDFRRLQQVGSPYWMSPECLKGEFYDEKADLFSYGIILCELIGRTGADPDVLPRTSNFGVDYIAFSAICPDCPPDFIQLSFNCVRIDPNSRPSAQELISPLETLLDTQKRYEKRLYLFPNKPPAQYHDSKITLKKVGHRRTVSDMSSPHIGSSSNSPQNQCHDATTRSIERGATVKASNNQGDDKIIRNADAKLKSRQKFSSPSEKARFHFHSVMSIGKEMSEKDPYYTPCEDIQDKNPFLALPLFQSGQKLLESEDKLSDIKTVEQFLFSSCFELTPNKYNDPHTTIKHKLDTPPESTKERVSDKKIFAYGELSTSEKRHSLPNVNDEKKFYINGALSACLESKPLDKSMNDNNYNSTQSHLDDRFLDPNPVKSQKASEEERHKRSITSDNINRYFEDQMFQGRVQLLRRLYGGGCWVTQDDSAIELSSFSTSSSGSSAAASIFNLSPETISGLKRRGSCESGFFSSGFGRNCSGLSSHYARTISSNASGGIGIDDWCSVGMMSSSARSVGSSMLTVSDLEEDLRAASIFLSSKRTSSVFTDDSIDDVSLADFETWDQRFGRSTSTPQGSGANIMEASISRYPNYGSGTNTTVPAQENRCYEKDIRDIVNYFNSITLNPEVNNCNRLPHGNTRNSRQRELDMLFGRKFSNNGSTNKLQNDGTQTLLQNENSQSGIIHNMYSQKSILPRSHKIESLIKRVAEKESKQRYRKTFGAPTPLSASMFQQHQQRLQVCDGIVRSKLQIFDHTKRPPRSRLLDHQKPGHVKAKLAIFDSKYSSNTNKIAHRSNFTEYQKRSDILEEHHLNANQNLQQLAEKKFKQTEDNFSDSTETLNA